MKRHTDPWYKERHKQISTFNNPTLPNFSLSYRKSYYLKNPLKIWEQIEKWWRNVPEMWHRARYGYCVSDWWGFDYYLMSFIPEAIRKFKWSMGYPGMSVMGVCTPEQEAQWDYHTGEKIDTPDWQREEWEEQAIAVWNEILEKIASGFEAGQDMLDFKDMKTFYQNTPEEVDQGYDRMFEGVRTEHGMTRILSSEEVGLVFDQEGWDALQAERKRKYEEGFDLFKEYFFSFWD